MKFVSKRKFNPSHSWTDVNGRRINVIGKTVVCFALVPRDQKDWKSGMMAKLMRSKDFNMNTKLFPLTHLKGHRRPDFGIL